MYLLISPAKTLDFETPSKIKAHDIPKLLDKSQLIIDIAKKLTPEDISALMKISNQLSQLNFERFQDWQTPFTPQNAKQAILAFKGDVYTGLDAQTLNEKSLQWANEHLGILSGLYGLLKPLDLIQPYRLEMGVSLKNSKGKNLYDFWGDLITQTLNQRLENANSSIVLNLASNEYFKSVKPKLLAAKVISPVFKDEKNGQYKIISFYAKKARGLMARWVIDNQITDAEQLKYFNRDGYYYDESSSKHHSPVFLRNHNN